MKNNNQSSAALCTYNMVEHARTFINQLLVVDAAAAAVDGYVYSKCNESMRMPRMHPPPTPSPQPHRTSTATGRVLKRSEASMEKFRPILDLPKASCSLCVLY